MEWRKKRSLANFREAYEELVLQIRCRYEVQNKDSQAIRRFVDVIGMREEFASPQSKEDKGFQEPRSWYPILEVPSRTPHLGVPCGWLSLSGQYGTREKFRGTGAGGGK
jgi:hypothetical protein